MSRLWLCLILIPSSALALLPDLVPRPQGVLYKGAGAGFTVTDGTRVLFGDRSGDLIAPLTRAFQAVGVRPRLLPASEDPAGGDLIAVGTRQDRAVDRLCRERGLDVSADYPGPEGYVIDVAPDGVVVAGSDSAGAFYGALTLAQTLEKGGSAVLEGVTVCDRPDLRMRVLFMMRNLLVDQNVDNAVALIQRATYAKMNRLFLSDFKFWLLGEMPKRYFDNVERVKSATRKGFMEIIPDVGGLGRSEGVLRHNRDLAEGYPVADAPFVAAGDTAAFLPDPRANLPNGDFEDAAGDRFSGWTWQEGPGVTTFADAQTVYSGRRSVRMENFTANAPHGNSRLYQEMEVLPRRNYYFSAYAKTRALASGSGATTAVIGVRPDGTTRELNYAEHGLNGTRDWTRLEANFNSLDCVRVRCYVGVWGGRSGTAWFDRAEVREIALVNVLRREGAPLTVTSKDKSVTYREGVDYAPVADPKLGMQPYAGNYDKYHAPPPLRILPSGAIRRGDTLLVSFYHPVVIYEYQVAYCVSEEETYRIYEKALRNTHALFRPRMMSLGHDEVRHLNHDLSCLRRGLTPARLLAGDLTRLREVLRAIDPSAQVSVWSDMLDPFHNARDAYYLVNGDLTGIADLVPKDLIIADWNRGKMRESVDFFASKGFRVFVSNDAGSTLSATLDWSETARRRAGGLGEMFTTWTQNYDNLETVADYMWSLSPYIDLLPAPPGAVEVSVTADRHPISAGIQIAAVDLFTWTDGTDAWQRTPMPLAGGSTYRAPLPENAAYYIRAEDSRGNVKTFPLDAPRHHRVSGRLRGAPPLGMQRIDPARLDFDGDGRVGFEDFFLFAAAFGATEVAPGSAGARFDLSGDGRVDFEDFFIFADGFGKTAVKKETEAG
jgi:hypothetical protein